MVKTKKTDTNIQPTILPIVPAQTEENETKTLCLHLAPPPPHPLSKQEQTRGHHNSGMSRTSYDIYKKKTRKSYMTIYCMMKN